MSNAGQHNPFRRRVAAQFVSNDHAWTARRGTQQLAEEPDGSKSVPSWLDENIENDTVLVDRSPEIVGDSVDLEEDFIQMPFVTGPSATPSQTGGIRSTKFVAPASDRLIAEQYSPSGHQFFHITEAHTEPEVQPNAVRNDLLREPMATVRAVRHSSSMPFPDKANLTIPVDQLFNSSEKRLARLLLLLANFGSEAEPEPMELRISQETLAEMVGTTRPRVSFFMNKFRRMGLIDYNGGVRVHRGLLNVVLHD